MRTRGEGTSDTTVDLGGQGPSASSPRSKMSPCPSCPHVFPPQHLTAALSYGKEQPRITDRLRMGNCGESFTQGLPAL